MIVSSTWQLFVNLIGTAFIGVLGAVNLASVAVALAVFSIFSQTAAATAVGYRIVSARRFGPGDRAGVKAALETMFPILVLITLGEALCLWFARPLLVLISRDPTVVDGALHYLQFRSPELVFFAGFLLLQTTFNTYGETKWGMYAVLTSGVLNISLSYVLIFGLGPFPGMQLAGAGLASALSTLGGLAFLAWCFRRRRLFRIELKRPRRDEARTILRLSSPEIVNQALDYTGGLVFTALIGLLGISALAAARVANVVLMTLFVLASNFGLGLQIMMGHSLGRNDGKEVRNRLVSGRLMTLIVLTVLGLGVSIWSGSIAGLFTRSQSVLSEAALAIVVVGVTAPFVAWTTTHSGALQALGHTWWNMYSNIATVWLVQIPVAYIMGVYLGVGVAGIFVGYFAYFATRATINQVLVERGTARPVSIPVSR